MPEPLGDAELEKLEDLALDEMERVALDAIEPSDLPALRAIPPRVRQPLLARLKVPGAKSPPAAQCRQVLAALARADSTDRHRFVHAVATPLATRLAEEVRRSLDLDPDGDPGTAVTAAIQSQLTMGTPGGMVRLAVLDRSLHDRKLGPAWLHALFRAPQLMLPEWEGIAEKCGAFNQIVVEDPHDPEVLKHRLGDVQEEYRLALERARELVGHLDRGSVPGHHELDPLANAFSSADSLLAAVEAASRGAGRTAPVEATLGGLADAIEGLVQPDQARLDLARLALTTGPPQSVSALALLRDQAVAALAGDLDGEQLRGLLRLIEAVAAAAEDAVVAALTDDVADCLGDDIKVLRIPAARGQLVVPDADDPAVRVVLGDTRTLPAGQRKAEPAQADPTTAVEAPAETETAIADETSLTPTDKAPSSAEVLDSAMEPAESGELPDVSVLPHRNRRQRQPKSRTSLTRLLRHHRPFRSLTADRARSPRWRRYRSSSKQPRAMGRRKGSTSHPSRQRLTWESQAA